jgi:hypothetical protein
MTTTNVTCPQPNPEWPAEFPATSRLVAFWVLIAWCIYLAITLVCLFKRRHYQPLRSRRTGLVAAPLVLGGTLGFIAVALREYIGRDEFPCSWYLYCTVLLVPATICPFVARLLHHRSRVEWQQAFMAMPLGHRTDEQQASLLASKYRASARRAYVVALAFFLCFVAVALVYQQTQERYHGECVGCEMTLGDTVLLMSMFLVLVVMVITGIRRLPKANQGTLSKKKGKKGKVARHPEVYDMEKALVGFAFWGMLWAVMRTVDPGNLDIDGTFASGYWLVFAMLNCSVQVIWIPVYHTYRKWGSSSGKGATLHEVLADPTMSQAFESFLMREFSAESYRFLFEVRRWVRSKPGEQTGKNMNAWIEVAKDIYDTFIADDSLLWVNISAPTKERLSGLFDTPENVRDVEVSVSEDVFAESVKEVELMLEFDSFQRFKASPEYKDATTNKVATKGSSAVNISSKRPVIGNMSSSHMSSYSSIKHDSKVGFTRGKTLSGASIDEDDYTVDWKR